MLSFEEYAKLDALSLAAHLSKGELESAEVLEAAIARAEEVSADLNPIAIPMFDEARAKVLEELPEGPFRGVPFLLKDLGLYYQGAITTNGCRFYAEQVADHDSYLVRRYKNAGLVVFGKSASPEFGLTTSTESVLFGVTHNPWNLEHVAGGSSGGAAAAVAAGILPAAHASDGGGSIRIPASCCGLFGLKPSRARVSAGPDLGEGWSGLSTAHVVSRSVRDSAALLDIAAGPEPGDPYWAPPPTRPYLGELSHPPGQLRIALTTRAFNNSQVDPECIAAAEEVARLCQELGHEVEEAAPELDREDLSRATGTIVGANIRANLEERAKVVGRAYTEDDVEPVTYSMAENAKQATSADYALAIRVVHRVGRQVAQFFDNWDVLLSPTMATPPKKLGLLSLSTDDVDDTMIHLFQTIAFTQLMNVAGNPAMSVPLAWSAAGLPIGIQFAAPFGDEASLFRLAAQLEEARPWAERTPF